MKLVLVENVFLSEKDSSEKRQRELVHDYYPGLIVRLKSNLSEITPTVKPKKDVSNIYHSVEAVANMGHLFLVTDVDYSKKTFSAAMLTSKYNKKSDYIKQYFFPIEDPSNYALQGKSKDGIAIELTSVIVDLPFNAAESTAGFIKDEVLADFLRARTMAAVKGFPLTIYENF